MALTAPPPGAHCACVTNHHPQPTVLEHHHIWPLGHHGPTVPENLIWLCPTAHGIVHDYLDKLLRGDGQPPAGWRRYNRAARAVAEKGYRRIKAQALVD